MKKYSTLAIIAVFSILLGGPVAHASAITEPTPEVSLAATKNALKTLNETTSSPGYIVIIDSIGTRIIEAGSSTMLTDVLEANKLSLNDYLNEAGTPAKDVSLTSSATIYLFKIEYKGTFKKIKLAPPVEKISTLNLEEGVKETKRKGTAGVALLTTVTQSNTPQTTKLDKAAAKKAQAKKHQAIETLTVVKPPMPTIVLIGGQVKSNDNFPAATNECVNGSSVPSTVDPDIIAIHKAVCKKFPEISTYGTYRDSCAYGCDHKDGKAVDIMVKGTRGDEVAAYIKARPEKFNVRYIMYSQHIWAPYRPYWKEFKDRGSITANHYDHVHVTVY